MTEAPGAATVFVTRTLPSPGAAGLRAAGHPAGLSLSAGAFVCNQVFFELQHALTGLRRHSHARRRRRSRR